MGGIERHGVGEEGRIGGNGRGLGGTAEVRGGELQGGGVGQRRGAQGGHGGSPGRACGRLVARGLGCHLLFYIVTTSVVPSTCALALTIFGPFVVVMVYHILHGSSYTVHYGPCACEDVTYPRLI